MKRVEWSRSGEQVPAVALGCMRMKELSVEEAARMVDRALELGVNFFDHADVYGSYVDQPIMVNQLQFGVAHASMVRSGMEANMMTDGAVDRDGRVLDYCRVHDITIQAWSPFQYGMFEGVFLGNEKFPELNRKMDEIAGRYGVNSTTIAVAWILRHPARMQVLAGTMSETRLADICKAADITLTREEWYEIYLAAGNMLP